jgi:hypothetical protein
VHEALGEPGDARAALRSTLEKFVESLAAVTVSDPAWRELLALLLGRAPEGRRAGGAPWLTDELRVRLHTVALSHAPLDARRLALTELETRGVPLALVPLLREIARTDPDPITRQHAKQLARGERMA